MARIAGVDLPRDKRIEYGLTYIYGIGLATSREILAKAGVDPDIRVKGHTERRQNVHIRRQAVQHLSSESKRLQGSLQKLTYENMAGKEDRNDTDLRRRRNSHPGHCR